MNKGLNNLRTLRVVGTILFTIGIVLGVVIFGLITWAKLESFFFFSNDYRADQPYLSVVCPKVMTFSETKPVVVTLDNSSKTAISPPVQVYISHHGFFRVIQAKASLAPKQKQTLHWEVSADDIAMGHLVIVKVYVYPTAELKPRSGTCGILVVDMPGLSGNQVLALGLGLCGLCLAAWASIWFFLTGALNKRLPDTTSEMVTITVVVLLGIITSLMGAWVISVVLLIIAVFLIGTPILRTIRRIYYKIRNKIIE